MDNWRLRSGKRSFDNSIVAAEIFYCFDLFKAGLTKQVRDCLTLPRVHFESHPSTGNQKFGSFRDESANQ